MIQYQMQMHLPAEAISISSFVQRAQIHGSGPMPLMNAGGATLHLSQGEQGVIDFGADSQKVVAYGLITCACVILVSTDPNVPAKAVVYHAPSGTIPPGRLAAMHAAIASPPIGSLLAVYATPRPWDPNYNAEAMNIQLFGVPSTCVVYSANFGASQFGINSHAQIGF